MGEMSGEERSDADFGRPLDGVRVLAIEQLQALPVATQMMVRMGAEVVKLEPPGNGESGRQSLPAITDKSGRKAGATFLRYNLGKRSIAVNLKSEQGRQVMLDLVPHFDVVCENLGPHRADKLGIGYPVLDAINPRIIVASLSGFGNVGESPYTEWPAFAAVAEAMSGIYEYSRRPHQLPVMNPLGGVGDTGTGLFALIGILAALRHRDVMGRGQYIDVSMFDTMISICDLVPNFWSLGIVRDPDKELRVPLLTTSFQASDGWFMMSVIRRHQFERLAELVGHLEWLDDERLNDQWGWVDHLEDVIRPAVEAWAGDKTKREAAQLLAEAKIAAAPGNSAVDLIDDPHVVSHRMLVEIERTDGVEQPVLIAGNPVKMSRLAEGPEGDFPTVGEHTDEVLREYLDLDDPTLERLRFEGAIA
jgi:crotonobetainyl-CoA:carnitine CoA-transferase CaiB-like acyl-CoA transferase